MKKSPITRLLFPILSGFLLYKAFPFNNNSASFIAWVALVPLFISLSDSSTTKTFFLSIIFIFSFGFFIACHFWASLRIYYELPFLKAFFAAIFFIILLGGPHFCAFFAITRFFKNSNWRRPFVLAVIWAALEFIYTRISLQARSIILGYTQHDATILFPILRVGGVYALSFFIMLSNLLITSWIQRQKGWIYQIILCAIIFLSFFSLNLKSPVYQSKETIEVSLLQTNLGHLLEWRREYYEKQVNRLLDMTKTAIKEDPKLIVWPSTSLILQSKETLGEILKVIGNSEIKLLIGARLYMPVDGGTKKFNSIILTKSNNEIMDIYLKKILMPYAEYLPFKWLDIFGKKKYFPEEYTASTKDYTVFNIDGFKFSALICLEILYPELVHRFYKEGARALIAFSNDESYITKNIPYYLLVVSKVRAIEFGIPVLRETINGYSAIIDYNGKILKISGHNTKEILTYDFNLGYSPSLYARYGNIFGWSCVLLTILFFMVKIII